ncbi:MAG: hypothetical protein M0023_04775 [Desulfobacteraceae bacterium]|nr:hypothetical protein [Desulfobacteraceae bacterium]
MKKLLFAAVMMLIAVALSGCGGGSNSPPAFVTQILSNPTYDGDIRLDTSNVFTVTQGNVPSVFAGIDPVTGSEYRAFLDFPLTGAGGVPGNAIINYATLDIFIDSISIQAAANSIPIRIELVSFTPPTLLASDYDRVLQPPLAFTTILPPITRADVFRHVTVDVTPLMVEAQRLGLPNFQVRILEDFGFVFPGLIEIDDTTVNRAPLLTVSYF